MLDRVFHVPNLDALKSLAPDSVLARFIRMPGMREPIEDTAIARDARVVPGSLIDGDSVAFVIIRRTDWRTPDSLRARFGGAELMTLRRYQGQWRSMLDGGVLYARNGMAFGFIREDSEPPHDH